MLCEPGAEKGWVDRINAQLPEDVRVFDVVRTTWNFNSKNAASGRQYGYLLPTFVLAPRTSVQYIARAAPIPQALKGAIAAASASKPWNMLAADLAADPFCNGTAAAIAREEAAAAYRAHLAATDSMDRGLGVAAGGAAAAAPAGLSIAALTAAPQPTEPSSEAAARTPSSSASSVGDVSQPDEYQTGAAYAAAAAEEWELRRAAAKASHGPFRLGDGQWQKLKDTFGKYVGTHSFHNFTPRMTVGDASAVRYISEASVSKPFIVGSGADAQEYVRLNIVGQSFLLNQIRHMVGLAVDVVRGAAPPHVMEWAFSTGVAKLPLAPAEGLYLDTVFFVGYDRRNARRMPTLTYLTPQAAARKQAFIDGVIFPQIARQVRDERPFHKYIEELNASPLAYRFRVPEYSKPVQGSRVVGTKQPRFEDHSVDASTTAPEGAASRAGDAGATAQGGSGDAAPAAKRSRQEDSEAQAAVLYGALAPVGLDRISGGAVSKVAREKAEFKRRLKEEREKYMAAKRAAQASGGPKPNYVDWDAQASMAARAAVAENSTSSSSSSSTAILRAPDASTAAAATDPSTASAAADASDDVAMGGSGGAEASTAAGEDGDGLNGSPGGRAGHRGGRGRGGWGGRGGRGRGGATSRGGGKPATIHTWRPGRS